MKKILLVEDEPFIRKLVLNTLEGQGYLIFEASNGFDALKVAREETPDLILLDLNIPGMDGNEVCKKIKSDPLTSDAQVIILTSKSDQISFNESLESGADDYFLKPFSPLELLEKVKSFLEHKKSIEGGDLPFAKISFCNIKELELLEKEQLLIYAKDLSKIYWEEVGKSKQLERTLQELKESEKMKDLFLAIVALEMETPINILQGHLELIENLSGNISLPQEIEEYLASINMAAHRLNFLIQEFYSFATMKSGIAKLKKDKINISDLLKELLEDYRGKAEEKRISIEINAPDSGSYIEGDYLRIKDAFSRLISNAINFTDENGRVLLECMEDKSKVEVRVSDTGIGIPDNQKDNIFTPFFQIADSYQRKEGVTGLGLSIARHIFELHGGKISLNSQAGKGSSFTVTLPKFHYDKKEYLEELRAIYPISAESASDIPLQEDKQILFYAQEFSRLYSNETMKVKQLEERLQEMEMTFIQTIASLVQAIDLREAYTGGKHTGRVANYARIIAKYLDPQLLEKKDFIYSLLLHDIGNIGIAEQILSKTDKLTKEEWDIIKLHPQIGAEIISQIKFLEPSLLSVRSHHERWDGNGYPDGLMGEEIPLPSRIIAVADALEAMTTDRPYRKALAPEEAKKEILKGKGTQYDPSVVDAFEMAWSDLKELISGKA